MSFFILVVIWFPVDAPYTLIADCQDCFQEFCNSHVGCYIREGPISATCNCNTSVVQCMNSTPLFAPLESPSCSSRSLNTSLSDGTISMLGSGFFILRNPRLCLSGCFNTMLIHTMNFNRSQESNNTLLKIHIFKRYSKENLFTDALFVEQNSSYATLSLVDESEGIVEATVSDTCFDSGDYFALTVGQALQIRSVTGVLGGTFNGARMYNTLPVISSCNSSSTVIMLPDFGGEGLGNQLPVMTMLYKGMWIQKFECMLSVCICLVVIKLLEISTLIFFGRFYDSIESYNHMWLEL